jgi:uncharacterized protein YdaU (DUF1376 family)
MSKAPWYKRYASDFVSDPYVQAMTAEQYGWFSAMLDVSWIHTPIGRLPNDLSLICKMIGRCDEMYFVQHSKIVVDRFKVSEDGKWLYHPRMMEQASRLVEVSENKSHPGKAGRKKKEIKQKSDDLKDEIKQGGESDSEPDNPLRGDEQIFKIAKSYPSLSQIRDETEVPQHVSIAIKGAIDRDGFETVLAATKKARGDRAPYPFFTESVYRKYIPRESTKPKWNPVAATREALLRD